MKPATGRIAITGAHGFVGRALTARARQAGYDVLALSRRSALLADGYEDVQALERCFAGADTVVHLAARAHVGGTDADFECNVRATRSVTTACRAAGVRRLVFLSSIGVNGSCTPGKPFDETDPPRPGEAYARSKLRCEEELRTRLSGSSTSWTILRPPLVYGPDAPGNFGKLVRLVRSGIPLPLGAVRNQRSLIGVDNLADVILRAGTQPAAAGEVFLPTDGDDLSTPELVRCIGQALGRRPILLPVPPSLMKRAARLTGHTRIAESLCDSLQIDPSKTRRVLSWEPPVPIRNGITDAVRGVRTP